MWNLWITSCFWLIDWLILTACQCMFCARFANPISHLQHRTSSVSPLNIPPPLSLCGDFICFTPGTSGTEIQSVDFYPRVSEPNHMSQKTFKLSFLCNFKDRCSIQADQTQLGSHIVNLSKVILYLEVMELHLL